MGKLTAEDNKRGGDLLAAAIAAHDRADAAEVAAWTPEMHAYAAELTASIDFARRIREARRAFGLSQRALAEIIDEDQGDISRLEHGELNPGADRMNRILGRLRAWIDEITPVPVPQPIVDVPIIDVIAASTYLCATYDERDTEFTMLKLQKLLYYAQGICLAMFRRPLFPDLIKRWAYGPVVPAVRKMYAEDGQVLPRPEGFEVLALPAEARAALDRAYAMYGGYTAWTLADMTHQETPWLETPDNGVITNERIAAYFTKQLGAQRQA